MRTAIRVVLCFFILSILCGYSPAKALPGGNSLKLEEIYKQLTPESIAKLTFDEFLKLSNKRKNFINRLSFNVALKKLKSNIKQKPNHESSTVVKKHKESVVLKILGYVIGAILILLLIIALIYSRHKN